MSKNELLFESFLKSQNVNYVVPCKDSFYMNDIVNKQNLLHSE
jgi:hypothetical protein